jgi:competence protein ComGC
MHRIVIRGIVLGVLLVAAVCPATAQEADRWAKPYRPAFGDWAFVWLKANFESLHSMMQAEMDDDAPKGMVFVLQHPDKQPRFEIRIYAGDGELDTPFYQQWLKTEKPRLEKQLAAWKAEGMDISIKDVAIELREGPWHRYEAEALESMVEIELSTLNSQTQLYRFKHNRLPKDMDDLVEAGLLKEKPTPPNGKYVLGEDGTWKHVTEEGSDTDGKDDGAAANQGAIRTNLLTLNSQTALFHVKEGRLPNDMEELIEAGVLREAPNAFGGKYVMDKDGEWRHVPAREGDEKATDDAAGRPVSDDKAQKTAQSLAGVAKLFESREGRWPRSVHELVEKDYLRKAPAAPKGKAYVIDAETGKVSVVAAENAPAAPKKFAPLSPAERRAAETDLTTLRTQMELFKFKETRTPKNLDEMVEKGYLRKLPDAPGERSWIYDASTGEVSLEGADL